MNDVNGPTKRLGYKILAALACFIASVGSMLAFYDHQPVRFRIDYQLGPNPGSRYFERSGDIWTEKFPGGGKAHYRIMLMPPGQDRVFFDLHGRSRAARGVFAQQLEDPKYRIFIPDYDVDLGPESDFHLRFYIVGAGKDWAVLGEMIGRCGYFRSYTEVSCE
jgi:hypothetical protein